MGLVHKHNIINKITKNYKGIGEKIALFKEKFYEPYRKANILLTGISNKVIKKRVELLNNYYEKIDGFVNENNITSQSKFRSTVLEEFNTYLFKDLRILKKLDLDFYSKKVFAGLKINMEGSLIIQTKDVDFCIGKKFVIDIKKINFEVIVPIVAVECKTYLDNTMFSEAQFTAQKLKSGTPNVKIYILTERNEIDLAKIPSQSPVDEIFVLRKNKNEPIDFLTMLDYFNEVKKSIEFAMRENLIKIPGRLIHP